MGLSHVYQCLKFGNFGVKGVHDTVEVHVEAMNEEGVKFVGSLHLPLKVSRWINVPFERAPPLAQ